jgi:hypothetical protein
MAIRKRKTTYPPARTANKPATPAYVPDPEYVRPTVAAINLAAAKGRGDLAVGDKVRILGTGLFSGEAAVIERFASAIVPSAVVRTEAGRTRQVRTIDLSPLRD